MMQWRGGVATAPKKVYENSPNLGENHTKISWQCRGIVCNFCKNCEIIAFKQRQATLGNVEKNRKPLGIILQEFSKTFEEPLKN